MSDSAVLADLSDALAAAVERAGASTVLVNARKRFPASGIAWSADTVLTCDHVVEREDDITVVTANGQKLKATIAGRDPGSDLALLRVTGGTLTPAEHAPEGSARVGNIVLAIGRPSDAGPMASFGVIGAFGGPWRTFRGTTVDGFVRTDTTFYPGFSGGPLIDAQGRVVGVNSSRLGRGSGLTIPIAAAAKVAGDLQSAGRIRRAYLGISSQTVQLPEALASKLGGQQSGLLVVAVEAQSPAEAGGFGLGDILVKFAGTPTPDTDSLQEHLGTEQVGKLVTLTVLRGGEPRDLTVTIGERK